MNRRHLYLLVALLTLVGAVLFIYKVHFLQFPLEPFTEEDTWEAEVRISFRAKNAPAEISLYIPRTGGTYSAVDEQFISRGFGINIQESDGNRKVLWSANKISGTQLLYFRTFIRSAVRHNETATTEVLKINNPNFEGAMLLAANILIEDIKSYTSDKDILIGELISRFNKQPLDNNVSVLLNKKTSVKDKLAMITKLLAVISMPARVVNGFRLENFSRDAELRQWLEVYKHGSWHRYNLESGAPMVDLGILPWWHGQEKLVHVTGGKRVKSRVSVRLNKEPAALGAMWREQHIRPILHKYSLLGLPIETQVVFQTLLTIPVGVFLLLLLKNIIGIKTIGTFTPVLIALAFREIPLFWGVLLFSLVVGLGLVVRFYFDRLKLSRTPRLTAVLIVVVILTGFISIGSYHLGVYQGLTVTLFPMVILAMTIERISVVWEKRGSMEAIQKGLGSLLVAITAYMMMDLDIVKHLVLMFPELLLVLLAATLLLGYYSGNSLSKLIRIRALAGSEK
jgi:hypothetical protein